jgi:16S rRNA (guanine527-N7)-methyltransferase
MASSEAKTLALLLRGTERLGLALTQRQQEQFEQYYQILARWNQRVNLTSVDDYEGVQLVHFLDSLTVLLALSPFWLSSQRSAIDIGAGAGFPGLPLKIVCPGMRLALVESVTKKTAFLHEAVALLELEEVQGITARAEELGHQPQYREAFDVALARAVAELPVAVELALPFCRVGGLFIAQKKGEFQQELDAAQGAIHLLGGNLREVVPVSLPGLLSERALVVIQKVSPTPSRYPRRPGIPSKRPLFQKGQEGARELARSSSDI